MKKQTLFYVLGGVAIAIAVVAIILVVCLFPKDSGGEPFDIKGTWLIYGGSSSTGNEEYMVFDEAKVSLYREKDKSYFSGDYTFEGDDINIPALSKSYYFKQDSTTSFYMIANDVTEYKLLKVSEKFPTFNPEVIYGEWNLVEKAGNVVVEETITLDSTSIKDFRNGEKYFEASYTWDNINTFSVEGFGSFGVYVLDEHTIYLIQNTNNELYIWKLEAK